MDLKLKKKANLQTVDCYHYYKKKKEELFVINSLGIHSFHDNRNIKYITLKK